MKLLPESNGLYKVNMKQKLSPLQWCKRIGLVIVSIFLVGFIFQLISNFVGKEKVESRLNYTKVDGKRLEYKYSGTGDYTIVFDGAIGANLYEWDKVCKLVEKELDVKTFVYNRNGYGFSSEGDAKTPQQQAEDLKILLRKAGVSGNIILVGEEYGSLVISNFAKLYPESVKGMVLIQPFHEVNVKSEEFKKEIKWKYYKSVVEKVGSSFGLTTLMDKMGQAITLEGFEESLPKGADEEFAVHKNKKDYRQAISNEIKSLYNYNGESQSNGLAKDYPLYIISNKEENDLVNLGNDEITQLYKTESQSKILSIDDTDSVFNGIKYVVKEAKRIERRAQNK